MRITGFLSAILTLAIALNGCAALAPTVTATSEVPAFTEASAPETTVPETTAAQEETILKSPATLRAYQFTLQQIAFEHVLPDGTELDFSGDFGFIEDNTFAIADVDGDGSDELIVMYSTAPMAAMRGLVYGYDMENDTLLPELDTFPSFEFYPGGLVKVGWSHNHTYGLDFWPYTLMRYNADTGVFEADVSVWAWDKSISDKDYDGTPFPEDKDPAGTGRVYQMSHGEDQIVLSEAEFQAWEEETFAGASALTLQWQNLTEDNIRALVP